MKALLLAADAFAAEGSGVNRNFRPATGLTL
jgi:hypothetical protein